MLNTANQAPDFEHWIMLFTQFLFKSARAKTNHKN